MAYATEADIVDLYGPDLLARVADRDLDGAHDAAAVAGALARASDEIDSHVGARYELPLAATPPVLVQLCVDIAVYRLAQSGAARTEEDRQRYDDAIRHLERIAKGHATLALPESGDPEDPTEGLGPRPVVIEGPARLFSRSTTRGL